MGIRMSGLSSGMDTEAIVKELMSAQSMKKNKSKAKEDDDPHPIEYYEYIKESTFTLSYSNRQRNLV